MRSAIMFLAFNFLCAGGYVLHSDPMVTAGMVALVLFLYSAFSDEKER